MTSDNDDAAGMRWRLVGAVSELRNRPCRRLRPVTSLPGRSHASPVSIGGDLVLVYVARLDKFFALDGICGHMGG